jgi:hypothetical protein
MKGLLSTAGGLAVANWGALTHSQTIAQEARRSGKRCIMLYMEGGVSQIDTFDMKPGRPTAGQFLPIQTNVNGIQVCEYLPNIARHADKLGIIRSMRTRTPDHGPGGHYMHTGYHPGERFPHPEVGAMIAKYCENPESDLPSFVKIAFMARVILARSTSRSWWERMAGFPTLSIRPCRPRFRGGAVSC